MYFSELDWKLKGFERADQVNKKYNAILIDKKTKKERRVPFGDSRFEQYKDSTGLGLYSKQDHGDKKRRALYHLRHMKDIKPLHYSPGYFSMRYLW